MKRDYAAKQISVLVFFLLLLSSCRTTMKECRLPVIIEDTADVSLILEDFESSDNVWLNKFFPGSDVSMNKTELSAGYPSRRGGNIRVSMRPNGRVLEKNYVSLMLRKKLDLSGFSGIKFFARSIDFKKAEMFIIESESLAGEDAYEYWSSEFVLSNNWEEVALFFEGFDVENFWDQEYISDSIMNLSKISGLGFKIKCDFVNEHKSGDIWIDDIKVFNLPQTDTAKLNNHARFFSSPQIND